MKIHAVGILKKAAPVTRSEHLARLVYGYLDETRKARAVDPVLALMNYSQRERYEDAIKMKRAPLRPGVDYIPSTNPAKVRLFGTVREAMAPFFDDVDHADPHQLLDQMMDWWLQQVRGKKVIASNLIFSMHPAISTKLAEHGVSVDEVLFANATHALLVYANRHYPGEGIGWIGGVHHDRAHPHLHAVVFPLTNQGRRLNLSPLQAINDGRGGKVRIDFQGTLVRAYWEQCKETAELVFDSSSECVADPKRAATDVAIEFATLKILNGRESSREAINEAFAEAERLPEQTLQAIVHSMSDAAKRPFYAQGALNVRTSVQRMRAAIQKARQQTAEEMHAVMHAREEARRTRCNDRIVGPLLGFAPSYIRPDGTRCCDISKALAPLAAEQTARTQRYQDRVKAFSNRPPADATFVSSRLIGMAGQASLLVAQATGITPWYLQNTAFPAALSRLPTDARSCELNRRIAAVISEHEFELRPFTVAEFGNKALSPYRKDQTPSAPEVPNSTSETDLELDQYLPILERSLERLSRAEASSIQPLPTNDPSL